MTIFSRYSLPFLLLIALYSVLDSRAQVPSNDPPLKITRIDSPIRIDGILDEAVWSSVDPFPVVQYEPLYQGQQTQISELRLAYDDQYLYFSCGCYETDPSLIQITSLKRDNFNSGFDLTGIFIDTFDDNENSLAFLVSAAGVRTDATITQDGDDYSESWNTFWDAATSITNEGWFAEFRIPLSSIRFNVENGLTTMGLTVIRYMARTRETHIFPDIPPNYGQYSWLKSSLAREVQFQGITSRRPLYITPYVIGGMGQEYKLNGTEIAYNRDDDSTLDVGLDIKYGLTNNLTLDVTVNTDFAQVEADDQQVNLTRFSLFFPEKRQFFLERASNFEYDLGGSDRLFYSRRIGIKDGAQVPIIGGARLVGRVGDWDVGAINIQTARTNEARSENFGVFRLRRQVFNGSSYVGALVTSRIDEDGMANYAYGVDAIIRAAGDDYLTIQTAQTTGDEANASFESMRLRFRWYRNRDEGFFYDMSVARSGADYMPGVGFQRRIDFSSTSQKAGYGWVPSSQSRLRQHRFVIESDVFVRNEDRLVDTWKMESSWFGLWRSGIELEVKAVREYEDLLDGFSLDDQIDVEPGSYSNVVGKMEYTQPSQWPLRTELELTAGSFYDGFQTSIQMRPIWNASRYFSIEGAYQFDRITFSKTDQSFESHLFRIRPQLTLSPEVTITGFFQVSSKADLAVGNFRFRYNPREGNDFYLVVDDGFNLDRSTALPRLPISTGRTILLKYAYTFLQ